MAQIVYYFYASLALGGPHRPVAFSVPTGNFGDLFAGYLAQKMGLPVERLVIATNANDILHRCISGNDHSKQALVHSLSPSMDIMVSSNFERLLFDLYDQQGNAIQQLMDRFASTGKFELDETVLQRARELFASCRVDDEQTVAAIRDEYTSSDYLLDPHSAIGLHAGRQCRVSAEQPMICLATAHPAKFPDAVRQAGYPHTPELPPHMTDLFDRDERFDVLPNDLSAVQSFIASKVSVS